MKKSRRPQFASLTFAKSMRAKPTPEENRLWFYLRDRRFSNYKFRRQQVIGKYIVDFVCHDKKLIIEADGSHHDINDDVPRDAYLRQLGYRILRFSNLNIKRNMAFVMDNIWEALHNPDFDPNGVSPSPPATPDPLPPGRGERKK